MTTDLETRLRTTLRTAAEETNVPARPSLDPHAFIAGRPSTRGTGTTWLRRRPGLVAAAVTAVAASAAGIAFGLVPGSTTPAGAAVRFTQHPGYIDAVVTDPTASAARLRQAFARQHLDITVTLEPVSPSLVGSITYTDGIKATPLQHGACVEPGGGTCIVGVRIPTGFTGSATIVLGRPARNGETYSSSVDALAPGEALHCSGVQQMTVAQAAPYLRRRGFTPLWMVDGTRLAAGAVPPRGYWVIGAVPFTNRSTVVEAGPKKFTPANFPQISTSYLARLNRGC